jgi:hypothetical protein
MRDTHGLLTAEEVGVVEVVVQQVQLLALVKQRRLGDELVVSTPEVASEPCGWCIQQDTRLLPG